MLRIHQSASAAHARSYYTQGLDRPDYYGQDGQSAGQWFGRGAERLGLAGEVAKEGFFALLDNKAPGTGDQLTARARADRRPGWDLVFSPPKSVSALRALTGDERIRDAMMESVRETLTELESDGIRTRLRRGGQQGTQSTGNLVASLFLHDTTRALEDGHPDPHDHVHAFIHNATWAEHEGRWQAAELFNVHLDRPYYEAAFEARLGQKLTALGYRIERQAKGWEIAGVPASVIEKFSRRTAEIEAEAEQKGITDANRKGQLGAKTRRRKDEHTSPEPLRQQWDSRLTAEERAALHETADRVKRFPVEIVPAADRQHAAERAVSHASAHLFERDSAVPVAKLLAEALRHGVGSVTPETAREELKRRGFLTAEVNGRATATTNEVLAEEQRMLRFARDGRGRCDPLGGYGKRWQLRRAYLNDGQKRAVRHLLGSFDRVTILQGKAGVGKSTLLAEVRDGIEAGGGHVLAVAPTTGATEILRGDGFHAETVSLLLTSEPLQRSLKNSVLLVDEAGLVGTRTMAKLFDLAGRMNARIVLSGDSGQHSSPERGAALRLLEQRAGIKPAGVTEILRQQGSFKEAVAALARGDGGQGFDKLDALGSVHEIADGCERYRQLAHSYADTLARGKEALAIAPTHAEGERVTAAIRAELRERQQLGDEERSFTRLENSGLTEAQRRDGTSYRPGDVVQTVQNIAGGWKRGERATVLGCDGDHLRTVTAAGVEKRLPLDAAARFQHFHARSLRVSQGDRLRLTQNGFTPEKKRLINGAVVTVAGFSPKGGIRLSNGWVLPKDHGHIAPGWVVTSHASQGRTVKGTVFVAQGGDSLPASSTQQFYVSVSRAKEAVQVYTDDKAALRRAVARSERATSATEVMEQSHAPVSVRGISTAAVEQFHRLRLQARYLARRGIEHARRGVTAALEPLISQPRSYAHER